MLISAIDGMPAIGKTALAIHLAYCFSSRYPDAQLFIDCYGYTAGLEPLSNQRILGLLLLALEIPPSLIPDSFEERVALWQSIISKRRMIVILDNVRSEKQIDQLLPCGNCSALVLITSREQMIDLPEVESIRLNVLDEQSAIKLLAEEAGKPLEQNRDLFKKVVQRLGYLPYPIVLFGRQIKYRKYFRLLMERFLETQTVSNRDFSCVEAAFASFETSYIRLDNKEKTVLKAMGISPCIDLNPDLCAAMINYNTNDVAVLMDSLYNKGMIIETGDDRYRLHDLMRDYSRLKFSTENSVSSDVWIKNLTRHYMDKLAMANELLNPNDIKVYKSSTGIVSEADEWTKWIDDERMNFVACLEYLYENEDKEEYIILAHLLARFFRNSMLGEDVLRTAEQAVSFSKEVDNTYLRATALVDLALSYESIACFTEALTFFHEAESLFSTNSDEMAYAYANEGFTLERLGNYLEALKILNQAQVIYESNSNDYGLGFVKNAIGAVHWREKKYLDAKDIFNETISIRTRIGDRPGLGSTKNNLGFTYLKLNDTTIAKTLFDESLSISQEFQDAHGESVTLNNLGYYYIEIHEYNQAKRHAEEARQKATQVGNKYQIARSYDVEGKAELAMGHKTEAKEVLSLAVRYFNEAKVPEYYETLNLLDDIDR